MTLLWIIVGVLIVFVVVVSMRPAAFVISRSITMSVPPSAPFELVNNFQKWEGWSPWAKIDPKVKNNFSGSVSGTGAVFAWDGNAKVGKGRMTIIESRPSDLVKIDLEFFKPMKARHVAEFTFKPSGSQTIVTWTMSGKNSFVGKAVTLFMDCDKMIGGMYDQGLASMKALAERQS